MKYLTEQIFWKLFANGSAIAADLAYERSIENNLWRLSILMREINDGRNAFLIETERFQKLHIAFMIIYRIFISLVCFANAKSFTVVERHYENGFYLKQLTEEHELLFLSIVLNRV